MYSGVGFCLGTTQVFELSFTAPTIDGDFIPLDSSIFRTFIPSRVNWWVNFSSSTVLSYKKNPEQIARGL